MQQGLTKFEKWIKIRIGEPITALDVNNENVIFGSISGYIGFYNIPKSDLKYIQEIFDEIIRGVKFYLKTKIHIDGNKAYSSVGDFRGLILNIEGRTWDSYRYEKRQHKPAICSSTLAMLRREKVVLLTVAPTQNKDLVGDISTVRNSIFLIDLDVNDMASHHIEMPQLCVPFDFDGSRILLLEYLKGAKKKLLIVDILDKTIQTIYEVPQSVEFISHGRLCGGTIIYVEDHKKIKCLDIATKGEQLLFSMDAQVIAFDVEDQAQGNFSVHAVDYYGQLKSYSQQKIIRNFNLFKVPEVHADLIKHKYIFDMGYPYYLRIRQDRMAISSDLGILVYSV